MPNPPQRLSNCAISKQKIYKYIIQIQVCQKRKNKTKWNSKNSMSKLVGNTQKANQSEAVNCIAKWLRVTQRRDE